MPRMDHDGLATDYLSRYKRAAARELGMPIDEITDEFAGMKMAIDLMAGDPKKFKQGYTRENAVIAVLDVMPTVQREPLQFEIDRFLR